MLTQYLHMGGLERMIYNLSTSLKSQGRWEPHVFVYDRIAEAAPDNDLGPAFAGDGISVTYFVKPPGFSFRAVLGIRRKLSADGIAVLHTHDLGALIYGVCAKLLCLGRLRLVHTQHSFVHLSRRRIYKYYERLFVRFADEITVVSPDTRKSYLELGVPDRKLHIVPNGVRFPQQGAVSVDARRRHRRELLDCLDPDRRAALLPFIESRWLLYMARLHRTKGQGHALALWEQISPAVREKSVLLFVGPESEPGRVRELGSGIERAPDSGRILYLGTTHRPELWLGSADVALSCSEFEGMPLGPIEAAGAGLPMVLSEIPGHEVVRPWSLQYPLSDPAKGARLVERLIEGIDGGADAVFAEAWKKGDEVRSRFAMGRMSGEYARFYETA